MAKGSSIGTSTETVMMPAPRIECDAQKYSVLGIRTMDSSFSAETPVIICLKHYFGVGTVLITVTFRRKWQLSLIGAYKFLQGLQRENVN